jgi:hypothetical protein
VKRTSLFVLIGSLAGLIPAYAHHSFAADYFEEQSVTYEGSVSEFQYRNPHSILMFEVRDDRGQLQTYAAEWGGTSRLNSWGITPDTLKPGDRVVVTGAPGRKASDRRVHLKRIHRPADGWEWSNQAR